MGVSATSKPSTTITIALLGASNLSRGFWAFSRCLRRNLPAHQVHILTALGPGRGFAAMGGLWFLKYPPVVSSPVFEKLRQASQRGEQTLAFLTDIGNDFLYEVSGAELVDALSRVMEQLEEAQAGILATPIHPLLTQKLTPEFYKFLRACLYPKSKVTYEQVIEGIEQVNQFMEEQARAGRITLVSEMDAFLGWDCIHYSWVKGAQAWTHAAEGILNYLRRPCEHPVRLDQMFGSYLENGLRLVGTDMLKLYPRRAGFF